MIHYNPDHTPNPEQWLALDEQIKIRLVEEHQRAARIKLPNLKVHAAFHVIVENQIAENTKAIPHPSTMLPSNASQQRGGGVANTAVNKDAQTAGFASCLGARYLGRSTSPFSTVHP